MLQGLLAKDRLVFGVELTAAYARAGHDVGPGDREPGLPASAQPVRHELELAFLDVQVSALFGLGERVGLELAVPVRTTAIAAEFLGRGGVALTGFESIHHRDEVIFGLGDPQVGARVTLLGGPGEGFGLDGRLGLTVPLGGIEPDPFALGRAGEWHRHNFYGHGTFDPVAGLELSWALGPAQLFGWGTARLPLYENRFGFRGSRTGAAGLGVASSFGLAEWLFLVQPELRHETPALWSGEPAENSGRTELVFAAGAFWMPSWRWQTYVFLKTPAVLAEAGGQLRMPLSVVLGVRRIVDLAD